MIGMRWGLWGESWGLWELGVVGAGCSGGGGYLKVFVWSLNCRSCYFRRFPVVGCG